MARKHPVFLCSSIYLRNTAFSFKILQKFFQYRDMQLGRQTWFGILKKYLYTLYGRNNKVMRGFCFCM